MGLAMAKGHRIEQVPEFPLVLDDSVESIKKTKDAVTVLRKTNAWADVERVKASRRYRAGRFCIWTASAFNALDQVYSSDNKKGFSMPRPIMANADPQRILQADEVKAALRPRRSGCKRVTVKKNPLKNIKMMLKLNPYV